MSRLQRFQTCFEFEGLTLRISSPDRGELLWLKEFLRPQFDFSRRRAADCLIEVEADTRRYRRLLARGPHPTAASVECFALDTRFVRHPRWNGPRDEPWVHDGSFHVFYRLDPDRQTIQILRESGETRLTRLALMRTVRECAMSHLHRQGRLVVHGAAFSVGRDGVVIAGEKRAGKTSLLIHALHGARTRYVSNDRVVIGAGRGAPRVRGIPTIASVRRPTLDHFQPFGERLIGSSFQPALRIAECRHSRFVNRRSSPRFFLSPAQLCALLDTSCVGEARLGAVVFPSVSGNGGRIRLRRLSREDAIRFLIDSRFRAGRARKTAGFYSKVGPSRPTPRDPVEQICRGIARRVPCYEVTLGENAYADTDWVTDFAARFRKG